MDLVIAIRACHFVCFVVLLLDCRVSSNVEFSLLTVYERGKVICEFADSQLAHYLVPPPPPPIAQTSFCLFSFLTVGLDLHCRSLVSSVQVTSRNEAKYHIVQLFFFYTLKPESPEETDPRS